MNEQNKCLNGIKINFTKESFLLGKHNESAVKKLHSFIEQEKGGIFTIFSKDKETGKTHLVQAAGNELWDRDVPVNYTTTEYFTSSVLFSLKEKTIFEKIYCQEKMDYILEDIQFAFDKDLIKKWIIGWLHYCVENNKKVMLTFRGDIEAVDPELKELLQSQSIVEIEKSDRSFKERVARTWASVNDVELTEDEVFDLSQRESLREIKCMISLRQEVYNVNENIESK